MDRPLILLSNRGPVTFDYDDSGELVTRRGGGGLVTALTGLLRQREALWIASAMTPADIEASRQHGGGGFEVDLDEASYRIHLVSSDPAAYDSFYNVIANPLLWFIQHYLWDLSNVPDIRESEREAWNLGYKVVNQDLAEAALEAIDGLDEPVVMVHDYHLYTCPGIIRRSREDAFLHHFVHIPWTHRMPGACFRTTCAPRSSRACSPTTIIGFHTRSYCNNFLQCCRELMGLETDFERQAVLHDGRETWVRPYPLAIDCDSFERVAGGSAVAEHEHEILRRRRDHMILRVDRADLSKNVLRGFTAFDIFLDSTPSSGSG
jgi:trehalose 6-phosphate synthase